MMAFRGYIYRFKDDQSPIGDLARDIIMDKHFPFSKDHDEMLCYLIGNKACFECQEAFEDAFKLYEEFLKCSK